MDYIHHYSSPLGGITVASDGEAITGLWFDGQKYFADTLEKEHDEKWINDLVRDIKSGVYGDIIRAKGVISSGGKNMLVNVTPNDDEIKFYPRFAEPGMTFIGSVLDHEKIEALKEV